MPNRLMPSVLTASHPANAISGHSLAGAFAPTRARQDEGLAEDAKESLRRAGNVVRGLGRRGASGVRNTWDSIEHFLDAPTQGAHEEASGEASTRARGFAVDGRVWRDAGVGLGVFALVLALVCF